jgi:transposase-like protein
MSSMPRTKLTPEERRALVLAALDPNTNRRDLAASYDVARSWLYSLLDEATTDPESKLKEAEAELEFRREVLARYRNSGRVDKEEA